MAKKNTVDVSVNDQGSIILFDPQTKAAKQWINDNIPDDAMYFGKALVVEHRYANDVLLGMQGDGLNVQAA